MQPHREIEAEEERQEIQEIKRRIERSAAFQRVFSGGKDSDLVLTELKKLVRGFDPNPYIHAFNAGVRSVLDFIDTAMNQDVESARKFLEEQNKE